MNLIVMLLIGYYRVMVLDMTEQNIRELIGNAMTDFPKVSLS